MSQSCLATRLFFALDEEIALSVRKMVLESAGYAVLTATDASQGLAVFKANCADLVITCCRPEAGAILSQN